MLSYSMFLVPLLLATGAFVLWFRFKDIFLLFTAIGFVAVFLSALVPLIWPPGTFQNGNFVPSTSFTIVTQSMQVLGTGGSLLGAVSFLVFSLRAKQYAKYHP